jgi:hypothetical protein
MFTKFTTGNAAAKVHVRVKGFTLTPTGAKAPKAACGARVTISYVPVADSAEVTCLKCHA